MKRAFIRIETVQSFIPHAYIGAIQVSRSPSTLARWAKTVRAYERLQHELRAEYVAAQAAPKRSSKGRQA